MAKFNQGQSLSRRSLLGQAAVVGGAGALTLLSRGSVRAAGEEGVFRAGAYAMDISPQKFPVLINGGFYEGKAYQVNDPLHARCLVLDDGNERVAIAVVDNCVLPRDLLDEAKELATKTTGIPAEKILISATHTHKAPSVMGCLGCPPDEAYRKFLTPRIAEGIARALKNLAPAKIGWTVTPAIGYTHCRRWILRPDRVQLDPFGHRNVRANMHPGWQNPDFVGPAGPVDSDLSMLSVQSVDGRPLAVLANFSMHYVGYGAKPVSADYYGHFAEKLKKAIGAEDVDPPFVGIMSQGTSGDLHWMDYGNPKPDPAPTIYTYADELAGIAREAYQRITYRNWVPLVMREKKLTIDVRMPSDECIARAKKTLAIVKMHGRKPRGWAEIYANEVVLVAARPPRRELRLQALRIGELGIAATPNEVFGLTGLKIKAQSPLPTTFVMGLANGEEGYIPPPAQYKLGGYTTWVARTETLETQAEPKIAEGLLGLLEAVSGQSRRAIRRKPDESAGYAQAVLATTPAAYWPLSEFEGPEAKDVSGNAHRGTYEGAMAFYLEGPASEQIAGAKQVSRAVHFAGGRMKSKINDLSANPYSVEMWFCNCLPVDALPVTGCLFSRGPDGALGAPGDHLSMGGRRDQGGFNLGTGADQQMGKLVFFNGHARDEVLVGRTQIELNQWYHVVLVRDGKQITVHLNGQTTPEISGEAEIGFPLQLGSEQVFVGGRSDGVDNFEGKICQVAIYGCSLSAEEVARHYAKAALPG